MQERKQRDPAVPIRNLDRNLYQRLRLEAIRRGVNVAVLLNQMMQDWLSKEETR